MQPTRGIFSTGLMATFGAIVLNIVFLYLSRTVFDIWPHVTIGQSTELVVLGYPQTIIATLIPGLVATVLYWALLRWTPWPNSIFGIISFIVLVLSFFGPFMLEIPGYEQLVLVMLHVLPAIAIVPTLMIAGFFAQDDECCDDCDMEDFCNDDDCEDCIIICDECGEDDCEEHMGDIMIEDDDCGCDDCDCDDDKECCGEGCCRDDAPTKKDVE